MYKLQSKSLVTTSASLCIQNGSPSLTIKVLNLPIWFLDFWYASLTTVHYNLKHGLAIVYLIWIAQPALSKSGLEVTWQAMLFLIQSICHVQLLGQTSLNWPQLSRCWCSAPSTPPGEESPMVAVLSIKVVINRSDVMFLYGVLMPSIITWY